ncbi:MAG: hypothetical protein K5663_05725 [Clostridiales bacterium]|nr:hypothetical protein [Clostridiales bacterium]
MSEQTKTKLFREKSLEAVESPESLNDYLRVTSPGVWIIMASVITLLVGLILWSIFGHIRSTAQVVVQISPEKSICYVSLDIADKVASRGVVNVEGEDFPIMGEEFSYSFISDETPARVLLLGKLSKGDLVAEIPVMTDLPDGFYSGEVITEDLQPISLLFQ